ASVLALINKHDIGGAAVSCDRARRNRRPVPKLGIICCSAGVRFWHLADIRTMLIYVRRVGFEHHFDLPAPTRQQLPAARPSHKTAKPRAPRGSVATLPGPFRLWVRGAVRLK